MVHLFLLFHHFAPSFFSSSHKMFSTRVYDYKEKSSQVFSLLYFLSVLLLYYDIFLILFKIMYVFYILFFSGTPVCVCVCVYLQKHVEKSSPGGRVKYSLDVSTGKGQRLSILSHDLRADMRHTSARTVLSEQHCEN